MKISQDLLQITQCINKDSWDMPTIFSTLQKLGSISYDEMLNVFNCGIGYCIVLIEKMLIKQ